MIYDKEKGLGVDIDVVNGVVIVDELTSSDF